MLSAGREVCGHILIGSFSPCHCRNQLHADAASPVNSRIRSLHLLDGLRQILLQTQSQMISLLKASVTSETL